MSEAGQRRLHLGLSALPSPLDRPGAIASAMGPHGEPRERRNARYLRSSSSSSAVRSSIAKAANLWRRPPLLSEGSN